MNAAAQYDAGAEGNPTLEGFLETTALVADVDSVDGAANRVTLMTLHSAKGLEFPIVYIVGVEQNLLPHERALPHQRPGRIRRGTPAAVRRHDARPPAALSHADRDTAAVRGRSLTSIPSEFLREIGVSETVIAPPESWAAA